MSVNINTVKENQRVICIMQARMGSSRLPGKILKLISGKPMLEHDINRISMAKNITSVVVATTKKTTDDVIVDSCKQWQVPYFRGSELDVLERYYNAALEYGADIVVRVTSDCPLICPELIDLTVSTLQSDPSLDYVAIGKGFPRGLNAEAFTMDSFHQVINNATEEYERVHVTPHYYLNSDKFTIKMINHEDDKSTLRWTVDTSEDLEMVRQIYDNFQGQVPSHWLDILAFIEKNPEISKINSAIKQKELHEL